LGRLLPAERQGDAAVIEIHPRGDFLTYGIGVSLGHMRTPALARRRAPVEPGPGRTA
jgi:hypothetical protein